MARVTDTATEPPHEEGTLRPLDEALSTEAVEVDMQYCSSDLGNLSDPPPYRAMIEAIDGEGLKGWCINALDVKKPVSLTVAFFGVDLCQIETSMPRPDVQNALGQLCTPGFHLRWSSRRYDEQTIQALISRVDADPASEAALDVRVTDGDLFLPILSDLEVRLTNVEMLHIISSVDPEPVTGNDGGPHTAVEGYIDSVDNMEVHGWALRHGQDAPDTVELLVDGVVVASTLAADPRGDLAALGIRNCAYLLAIPAQYYDGAMHRIEVRTAEDGIPLAGSPIHRRLTSVQDGRWMISGRKIDGWIIPALSGNIKLSIWADGMIAVSTQIDGVAGEMASFSQMLPISLIDGQSHTINVSPTNEPGNPLLRTQGGTQAHFSRRVKASIDSTQDGFIRGWAFDCCDSDRSIEIELWDGPVILGRTVTDLLRQDVNKHFDVTGNHGFSIAIPIQRFDGRPHNLCLKALGEDLTVAPTKRLPEILNRSLLGASKQRFVGKVDSATCQEVSGWVADKFAPFQPVRVAIIVDDVCEAIILADQFQKRLQPVAGSGYHAFRYQFPARLMNSTRRKVEVRVVSNNTALPIGAKNALAVDLFFPLIDFFAAYEQCENVGRVLTIPLTNVVPRPTGPAATRPPLADGDDPAVSVIVLNWNGATLVEELLNSIAVHFAGESLEVLLVDHGSSDDSLAVAERFSDRIALTVLARKMNYSFSASNNFAASQARGRYLFFVNNDLVFTGNCLPAMTAWLEQDESIGIVGMRLAEPLPKEGGGWRYAPHHRGIQFLPKTQANKDVSYFPAEIDDHYSDCGAAFEMPAVTGAALLCRKDDFLAIDGFDKTYFYGLEDVDLCLRMSEHLNKRIICDTTVTALHNRSFTRTARLATGKPNPVLANPKSQTQNAKYFASRFGRRILRETLLSLINGKTLWRTQPLRVTFVITDASLNTPAGDFYTAMEMAEAMRKLFGWETLFAKRDVTEMPGTDVLIVMRHDFNLSAVRDANPGLVTVAWIRNRVDEWLASPHWDAYNLIFCSSNLAIRKVVEATGRVAHLLPIATNEERFRAKAPVDEHKTDILFTGNYWGATRDAMELLDQVELPGELAIYGHGWHDHERLRKNWRQAVPYVELADIYPSAKLVIDDSHPVTREWNSLNSRVFDALGSGTLVVTNCRGGAEELFGDLLPTFSTRDELLTHLQYFIDHPDEREALAVRLREEVLANHTYKNRAQVFKSVLGDFVGKALRFSIKVGIPNHAEKHAWGDWHFALAIKRTLEKAGHYARIDILPEWYAPLTVKDDAVIVLRGLSAYKPVPSKINLMWLISHPDEVSFSEFDEYDHVFVASKPYTELLQRRLGDRVSTLLQCTDPSIFYPTDANEERVPDVLFVGNSRGVRRPIIDDALQMGIDIGVYGQMWGGIIPHGCVLGEYIPNDGLRAYYSNAKIVLNDHWPDMKREGFVSNRVFDAGACGAAIVSDDIVGLQDIFGESIITYDGPEDLQRKVESLLSDEDVLRSIGERLRQIILAEHTFEHRVRDILATVAAFA
ncbi:glycosyltransferase family protein [Azospirillum isscasi]|uniref:Glycosyltransferase n=1 Tax=Azospirillum isscasi TaxID=3053926 RepID=A0ABU0WGJ9_9PROT|nr:glycosyltransferase [Azospirillum isscasi]MDQ2103335.1 glycosyltransferase [Azospirillum isscasi]